MYKKKQMLDLNLKIEKITKALRGRSSMLFQYHIINMYTKISLLLLNDTNAMIEKL